LSHGVRLALLGVLPLAFLLLGLILLQGILLPFVVGMAAAYLLDPAADALQRLGLGRTAATVTITLILFVGLLVALVLVLPALITQEAELAKELPHNLEQLRGLVTPWLSDAATTLGLDDTWSASGLIERFFRPGGQFRRQRALPGRAVRHGAAQSVVPDLRHAGGDLLSAARLGSHGGTPARDGAA
jgi:hypothetical protein